MADAAPETQYVKKPVPRASAPRPRAKAPPSAAEISQPKRPSTGKKLDPMQMASLLKVLQGARK